VRAITEEELHEAAIQIADSPGPNAGTVLDGISQAALDFMNNSTITDEDGNDLALNRSSLGYGIMLGALAAGRQIE